MKRSLKAGIAITALALATGVTASAASAATQSASAHHPHSAAQSLTPHYVASNAADTNITGTYFWNGDGFTGTLDIYGQVQGVISAELVANNGTEWISGNWNQSTNTLTLTRPLTGYVQYYTYFLGGTPYSSYPQMFGGYYTTTASGSLVRGTYLDTAL
jgi:hypothetical protein